MTRRPLDRAAVQTTCRACSAPVLSGLDDDVGAELVRVEPAATDYLTAVVQVLARRPVYGLARTGDLYRLDDLQLADGGPGLELHLPHTCPTPTHHQEAS